MTAELTPCPKNDPLCGGGNHENCWTQGQYADEPDETPGSLTPEERARASIDAIENAGDRVACALNAIALLEDLRALIKPEAVKRLIDAGFATSATAAEKIVERDEEYTAHRERQRAAECEKWGALAAFESAKLHATLDVALAAALANAQGAAS